MVKAFIACALAFLVLVPDLSGEINDRNNDPDSAKHLPDRADHLPVHNFTLAVAQQKLNTERLESAIARVIAEGKVRTYDMDGNASTLDVAKAVADYAG